MSDKESMKKTIMFMLILSLNAFAQEESEALRALRLSCQQNVGLGCYNYANMLLKRDQPENADKYFEMGCKLEHSDSCSKKSWGAIEASSQSAASVTPEEPTSSEPVVSSPEITGIEETSMDETPSPAPASVEEPAIVNQENQASEEVQSEVPSPEETELDLSAIE